MHKTAVLNVVALTPALIGEHTPNLRALRDEGELARVRPPLPAVTCTAQADFLTGTPPREHGIVGNGWYFRDTAEVRFWQQADALVQRPRIWDEARRRDRRFTCANLFWWHAMYCGADWTVTPRPMYPADGRKIPDVWTNPPALREELQAELGRFPLFEFWGPMASIRSSEWIARAAVRVDERLDPTLSLIYLPHLDYALQKHGPEPANAQVARALREIDAVAGRLIEHFRGRGARIVVLSEYGIELVSIPVHLNRVLREAGLLAVREELGREILDAGASRAFAVCDHQVAHVYVRDAAEVGAVRSLIERVAGVERVLDESGKREAGLDHPRAGDLVAVAEPGCWFTYYFWLEDSRAPDYARTVDIHRKPGYDPAELFLDPNLRSPRARIALRLLQRKLGMRALLDVIGLDAGVVRGSHGRPPASREAGPLLMTNRRGVLGSTGAEPTQIASHEVRDVLLGQIFD